MEYVNNENVLKKIKTKMILLFNISKQQSKLLGDIMKKEVRRSLIPTEHTESKRDRGK